MPMKTPDPACRAGTRPSVFLNSEKIHSFNDEYTRYKADRTIILCAFRTAIDLPKTVARYFIFRLTVL